MTEIGEYSIEYFGTYGNGLEFKKIIKITVVADDIAPTIVINGEYQETYLSGQSIGIIEASTMDNTGYSPEYTVTVFFNDSQINVSNGKIKLKEGRYSICYKTVDHAGNSTEKKVEFTVNKDTNEKKQGCKGSINNWAVYSLLFVAAGVIATRKNKKENNAK